MSAKLIIDSQSPEQTRDIGRRMGLALRGGELIALDGQLGAGKTALVKGIALGNGLEDASAVTSPTFTLVNEYPGRLELYHLDAYRLRSGGELLGLGFDEMLAPQSCVVIEWAGKVVDVLPPDRLAVEMTVTGPTSRQLALSAWGSAAEGLLKELSTQ